MSTIGFYNALIQFCVIVMFFFESMFCGGYNANNTIEIYIK